MPTINAVTLLKQDHKKVKELLTELAESSERAAKKRASLLQQITLELEVHTKIEEEIFYPAFRETTRKRDEEKLFFEATEEHNAAKMVLDDLQRADPATLNFAGKAKVLKELVEHHIKEEERDMFPHARENMEAELLSELGERIAARKKELLRAGKNGAARQSRTTEAAY